MSVIASVGAGTLVGAAVSLVSGIFGMSAYGCLYRPEGYKKAYVVSSIAGIAALCYAVADSSPSFAIPAVTTATTLSNIIGILGERSLTDITLREYVYLGSTSALAGILATYGLTT